MLTGIRKSVNSYVTKVLLLLLVLSFITFYGYQNISGCHPSAIAKVDGELIQQRDYRVRLQNQLEQFRRLFNRDLDESMIGMVQQSVLDRMINERLLVKQARQAGLRISDAAVSKHIEQMFSAEGGKFDPEIYKKYVNGYLRQAPHQFEEQQRDALLAQKFQDWLAKSAKVSNAEAEEKLKFEQRELNLAFLSLNEKALAATGEVSEAQLNDYFKKHEAEYKSEVTRKIEYAYFAPPTKAKVNGKANANIGADADPKVDAELKALAQKFADAAVADVAKPFSQLKLPTDASAKIGMSDYVDRQGVIAGVQDSQMLTARLFDMQPREVSEPLKGWISSGYYVIRLIDERPARPLSFTEAKEKVRAQYLDEQKNQRAEKWMDEALAALKSGKSLSDIAKINVYSLDETGFFKVAAVSTIPKVGFSTEAVKELALFTAQKGGKTFSDRPLKIGNSHYLFALKGEKGATADEIKASLATEKQQLQTQKQSQLQSAWLTGMRQRADKNGDVQLLMSSQSEANEIE